MSGDYLDYLPYVLYFVMGWFPVLGLGALAVLLKTTFSDFERE